MWNIRVDRIHDVKPTEMRTFFLLLLLVSSNMIHACGCNYLGSITDSQYVSYDYIVTGTIKSIEIEKFKMTFVINVEQSFKGTTEDSLTIETNSSSLMCGLPVKTGQKWLLFARIYNGKLSTSLCTRSKKLSKSDYFKRQWHYYRKSLRQDLRYLRRKRPTGS